MRWGLVVQQPYAQFIAEGWKWTETRVFVPRNTLQQGDDLVIIAGQTNTLGNRAGEHWEPAPHCGGWRMRRVVTGQFARRTDRTDLVRLPEVATIRLSFGAAIAVVRYDGALPCTTSLTQRNCFATGNGRLAMRLDDETGTERCMDVTDQLPLGIWAPGRSGWLLSNQRKLAHPLAMTRDASASRQMQGVFELTPAVQQWVADELEAS